MNSRAVAHNWGARRSTRNTATASLSSGGGRHHGSRQSRRVTNGQQTIGLCNIQAAVRTGAPTRTSATDCASSSLLLHAEVLVSRTGEGARHFPAASALDELFEILTLAQTDKLSKKIGVVLCGRAWGRDSQLRSDVGGGRDRRRPRTGRAPTRTERRSPPLRDHLIAQLHERGSRTPRAVEDEGDGTSESQSSVRESVKMRNAGARCR